ncbi:SLC37A3 isoform 19 [Pan troglodytes]|uniref:Solute carrier family 37 member 3 n=2 Tax=Homininae TaxID=207598 RepID=F8WC97_HUMAN|nr:solute carrier family 37 member 3 [Homo sapiens]KAI4016046.1 solute carrier family 37 member 3 [Homo sapiens]PNI99722.1 SLC37A3 isoform 19 [Pan troglodytes]
MAWPNVFQRGSLLSQFSHHHVVVFLLTFFRCLSLVRSQNGCVSTTNGCTAACGL